MNCAGCHDLTGEATELSAPDLTFEGSKRAHDLDFGAVDVRHTLPDFLYTKLRAPRSLKSDFQLPLGEDPAAALWKNLQPAALFSKSAALPEGSAAKRLAWILQQVQARVVPAAAGQNPSAHEAGDSAPEDAEQVEQEPEEQERGDQRQETPAPKSPGPAVQATARIDAEMKLPTGPVRAQAAWLLQRLNGAGLLNSLKMPDFQLDTRDAEALTIALMSLSAERISATRYVVPRKRKVSFNPRDEFGQLERRYRCLSCHGIRGSGDILASDLTFEGNRVNREWLYHFLKKPYSMRRTLTIAMPLFDFPDEEARFMAEYITRVFVDSQVGAGWRRERNNADPDRGQALFDGKGCIACHQRHDKGGDIGPSLTTQVLSPRDLGW